MSSKDIYNQNQIRPGKPPLGRDRQLVLEAVQRAGGQKALAKMFGVAQSAISEWGRTRPIPRHVKPRLEDYLKPIPAAVSEQTLPPRETAMLPAALDALVLLLRPDLARRRVAHLAPRARRRYEERVREILVRVRRELEEFQAVLEAEPRRRRRRRANGVGKGRAEDRGPG